MRYTNLTTAQSQQLTQLYKTSSNHQERQRAHCLLLSSRGYSIPDLADLFAVDRDTITRWMDRWQDWLTPTQQDPISLQDQPRSGRPSVLDAEQKKR